MHQFGFITRVIMFLKFNVFQEGNLNFHRQSSFTLDQSERHWECDGKYCINSLNF
jgi:hypothetical protein